jgi:Ion channel
MTEASKNERPGLWSDGWLVVAAYFFIFSWSRWVSPGGFALFHRRTATDGRVRGRTWLQDLMHLGWAVAAAGILFRLDAGLPRRMLLFLLALASFRLVDLLVDCAMLAVFGNRYGRPWQGVMPARRLHRTLIIDFLLLLELVFWNASWAWLVSMISLGLYDRPISEFAHALHFSMATVTTIGYGTYAPVATLSVLAALLQALSTLLLLSGVIAGVFSRSTSIAPGSPEQRPQPLPSKTDSYGLCVPWDSGWGWNMRWVLPILAPAAVVVGTWLKLLGTEWLK